MSQEQAQLILQEARPYIDRCAPIASIASSMLHKDGSVAMVEFGGFPVIDEAGVLRGYRGTARDISERIRAEEALRNSEERYRLLFEQSPDMVFLMTDMRFIAVNPTVTQILGYEPEELIGCGPQDITPEFQSDGGRTVDKMRAIDENLSKYFKYGTELTHVKKDGSLVECDIRVIRHAVHGENFEQVIVRDATERKRAEKAMRDRLEFEKVLTSISTEFINLPVDRIDAGINRALQAVGAYTNVDRCYIYLIDEVTTVAAKVYEWDSAGIEQLPREDLCLQPEYYHWFAQRIWSGKPVIFSRINDLPEEAQPAKGMLEQRGVVSQAAIPMVYREKTIGFAIFETVKEEKAWTEEALTLLRAVGEILVNAMERRRADEDIKELTVSLERRIAQRTSQLEEANKELEAFTYSVSHDLRAPLRSIDGFSLAVMQDYSDILDDTGQDFLKRVRAATQRMAQLIDDLLRLSRVTRVEMQREKVNLSDIVSDILADLHSDEPDRQVETIVQPDVIVECDRDLLRIALQNLLDNAWKFTGKTSVGKIEFGRTHADGEWACFVRDNGAGFDMEYVDKLFKPFQRLHAESEFPGTGIGLAMVKRIINRHGGRIWAEGAIYQGATFYFTL